jgi:hypothetical protein
MYKIELSPRNQSSTKPLQFVSYDAQSRASSFKGNGQTSPRWFLYQPKAQGNGTGVKCVAMEFNKVVEQAPQLVYGHARPSPSHVPEMNSKDNKLLVAQHSGTVEPSFCNSRTVVTNIPPIATATSHRNQGMNEHEIELERKKQACSRISIRNLVN